MVKQSSKKLDLTSFFTELASPVRMQILEILSEGIGYRNSEMARSLGVSAQESLRHLSRLIENQLVVQEGREYLLSQIGRVFIEGLLPQISFLLEHSKFFQLHDLSVIPPILTRRFAEITTATLLDDPTTILQKGEEIIQEASERVWDIAKLVTNSTNRLLATKSNELDLRAIEERQTNNPKIQILGREVRRIDHIDLAILLSEKSAFIRFPLVTTGELSLNYALYGKDPTFLNFCYDLFQYYWEQATPVSDF